LAENRRFKNGDEEGNSMKILNTIREDIQMVLSKDPAARGMLEVLLCYPRDFTLSGCIA